MYTYHDIDVLKNQRVLSIDKSDDRIIFNMEGDKKYVMEHQQDCCERVYVEDFNGDLEDFEDAMIVDAWKSTRDDPNAGETGMWTFYNVQSSKGHLFIRWYGYSNGYYGVGVSFYEDDGNGRW